VAVSAGRRGIDRMRWEATRRAVLERDQYRCRKDELAAGRNSTTTQLRKTDTLVADSTPPGWCRPCAQVQSRFCACVRTGAWACAAEDAGGAPATTEKSPGKLARFVAFCFTPTPASDQHRCRRLPGPPGFPQGAFRRLRRRRPGRITGVIGSAPSSFLVGCTARRLALPITYYYTEGRGAVAGDLRGVAPPLRLSTHAGGKPPTPPYLNLHNTAEPARRPDDHDKTTSRRTASQLPPYPAGASTARPSHAPAPAYHPTAKTRRRVTHRTHGGPAAGTPRRRTSRSRRRARQPVKPRRRTPRPVSFQ